MIGYDSGYWVKFFSGQFVTHNQSANEADLGGVINYVQVDQHLVDVGKQLGEADGFKQAKETESR